jgi:hypothetical protein
VSIKRPPFEFEITENMKSKVNEWVDILEGRIEPPIAIDLLRIELLQEARCIPGAGHSNDHDEWMIHYYLDGGWRHDVDVD